jgi:hypothetical protein
MNSDMDPRLCEKVHNRATAFIHEDRRLAIRMIADELNINGCTVYKIVTQNLNMRNVCAKMVPKYVDDQKPHRMEVSAEMFEWLETEQVSLNWVITSEDGFTNVALKQRGRVWNSAYHSFQDRKNSHEQIKAEENGHIFFLDSKRWLTI